MDLGGFAVAAIEESATHPAKALAPIKQPSFNNDAPTRNMSWKVDSLNINLPFGLGGTTIVRTEAQRNVAWALYVELATRISTQELKKGQGSAREALNSVYSLFDTTRGVLRAEGPGAAEGPDSIGVTAIKILNEGVRPFLVEWHTKLSGFEDAEKLELAKTHGGNHQVPVDEGKWEDLDGFYVALNVWRLRMLEYLNGLAAVAGISA